jgi:radical SAM protein with 4Fe4S-binding SPASM domain
MSETKIYCPSMWKSVHVDTDGYLTPCCLFIHKEDKKSKLVDIQHAETILQEEFQEYRDQLSNGIWPSGCNQCKFAEEEGRDSKRQQDMWMLHNGTMQTPPEDVSLEYLQLKTGRLCNLRCTICTPACSTAISTELLRIGKLDRATYDRLNEEIAWSYDVEQYKKLNPGENGYFRIDIAGGEPLLNKTHFEWLDQLPNPEKTILLYNTNGTQRPTRKEIDIWKKFRGIILSFSIDSYGDKFEKLRVGAKWDQVLDNLKYCQEEIIAKEFDLHTSNVSVVMTVSKMNVRDAIPLYKILNQYVRFNNSNPLNFNYLYYPDNMACHNMSRKELEEVIGLYDAEIPSLPKEGKMRKQCVDLRNSLSSFLNGKEVENPRPMPKDHRE